MLSKQVRQYSAQYELFDYLNELEEKNRNRTYKSTSKRDNVLSEIIKIIDLKESILDKDEKLSLIRKYCIDNKE